MALGNAATWIIAGMIIVPGIYLLVRSIRQEAVEGKCAACSMKDRCQTKDCILDHSEADTGAAIEKD